jgi:hypothetical protein
MILKHQLKCLLIATSFAVFMTACDSEQNTNEENQQSTNTEVTQTLPPPETKASSKFSESEKELEARAQKAAQALMGQLKEQLQASMKSGGPAKAVETCHRIAPALAKQISEQEKLSIQRVSLKYRNPQGQPDAFETKILEDWQKRDTTEAQDKPKQYQISMVQSENGEKTQFRYMQSIRIQPACLKCHGEPSAEVKAMLKQYYPKDLATGYKLGELRGAVSVSVPVTPQ